MQVRSYTPLDGIQNHKRLVQLQRRQRIERFELSRLTRRHRLQVLALLSAVALFATVGSLIQAAWPVSQQPAAQAPTFEGFLDPGSKSPSQAAGPSTDSTNSAATSSVQPANQ